MIAVLVEALRHRAEVGCVLLGAVPILAGALGWRRSWSTWAVGVAIVAFTADAVWFRETRPVLGIRDLAWDDWAGLIALYHAYAARIGWIGATVAALVLAVDRREPGRSGWMLAVAGGLFALSAIAAPQLGWVALALVVVGIQGHGVAAVLLALAAIAGAEANLYTVAALVDPADLRWLDPSAAARVGAWVGAGLTAVWGLRQVGLTAGLAPIAALLGLVALDVGWAGRSLALGPSDEIAALRDTLPTLLPGSASRVPGGCLVTQVGDGWSRETVGPRLELMERRGLPACAASGPASVPIVAASGDTPIAELFGEHESPVGEVVLLARMDRGVALPEWRVTGLHLPVWEVPGDPRGLPLPGAVLIRRPGTLDEQLAQVTDTGVRLDVLVHPTAAPTVDALLALCRGAEARHPTGLRCVLVGGDPDGWSAALARGSRGQGPNAHFETVETDEDEPFR